MMLVRLPKIKANKKKQKLEEGTDVTFWIRSEPNLGPVFMISIRTHIHPVSLIISPVSCELCHMSFSSETTKFCVSMEYPRFGDPYPYPYEGTFSTANFSNMSNPTLPNFYNDNGPIPLPQQDHHGLQQGDYLIPDPMILFGGEGNLEVGGPSQLHGDQNQLPNEFLGSQSVSLMRCSDCKVIRQIVHANELGIASEGLEIHGWPGTMTHAIHYQINSSNTEPQFYNFEGKRNEEIGHFLEQYHVERGAKGYTIFKDPMSDYYKAICTGLNWVVEATDNEEGPQQVNDMVQEVGNGATSKLPLTKQRERLGKMTLNDFSNYFHLPLDEAARELNTCTTVVKKICRKEGIQRWPRRKVQKILRQISKLRNELGSPDVMSRAKVEEEITRLEQEMIQHCGGIRPSAILQIVSES